MKFRAQVQTSGKTATGVQVPPEVVEALGSGKRPAVHVTVNGYSYRSTVAPIGGVFMLPVSAEVRGRAGIAGGDEVEVDLVPDTEPRTVNVPPDLAEALSGDPQARAVFEGLSYSRQQRLVLPIEQARTAETRSKRVSSALDLLRGGQG